MTLSLKQDNPANVPEKGLPERKRIPMSLPIQKLAVPEIPGYYLYWMRGDEQRINQALRAGYTFVEEDEVELNRVGVADGEDASGNQDLGSRVSVVAGMGEGGNAVRLYLMKLPMEFREQDLAAQAAQQEQIAGTLRGDSGFTARGGDVDNTNRYSRNQQTNLFTPKR